MPRQCRTITLELPLPPSVNRMYGRTKAGRVYLKRDVLKFRTDVTFLARGAGLRHPFDGPVRVEAVFRPWRAGVFDADNRVKALQDALERAGVVTDDRQVVDLHATLGPVDAPLGSCTVRVTEIR